MDVKITQINTTGAKATLSHDDIVKLLGLGVMVQAGIASSTPGTTVNVSLAAADEAGRFTAAVDVIVDHNYQPPSAVESPAPAQAPAATDPVATPTVIAGISGLAIPTAPAA